MSSAYVRSAQILFASGNSEGSAAILNLLQQNYTSAGDLAEGLWSIPKLDFALFVRHKGFLRWLVDRLSSMQGRDILAIERAYQAALSQAPDDEGLRRDYLGFLIDTKQSKKAAAVDRLSKKRFAAEMPARAAASGAHQSCLTDAAATSEVTIIVPVFGGAGSLQVCLDALLRQDTDIDWHLLLVDDASTDADIAGIVQEAQKHPRVSLITLTRNRGYIGAINAALEQRRQGDVLLLNSDCIVPSGDWLDRLRAHAGAGIGTVTPLSNNGEYLSFPLPFISGPAFVGEQLDRIDRAAAAANKGRSYAVLSSVGYCTYITRACLDAIGNLSTHGLEAGYGEEVDFCLRASRAGFGHLAACDVYVTHVGSASFRSTKRLLVKRNEEVLQKRFPHYQPLFQAQIAADPLREARARLERHLLADGSKGGRLLVTQYPERALRTPTAWKSLQQGEPLRIAKVRQKLGGVVVVKIRSPGLLFPQNLKYELPNEYTAFEADVKMMELAEILVEEGLVDQLTTERSSSPFYEFILKNPCFSLSRGIALHDVVKNQINSGIYAGLYI